MTNHSLGLSHSRLPDVSAWFCSGPKPTKLLYACSPRQDREYEAAKNSAAGSLSLRPHSRKELEIKLKDKGYSEGAVLKALDRLKELVCPCKQFALHCLSLQTSTGHSVTRQYTILCVMQHWQSEVAKILQGSPKALFQTYIHIFLILMCALMSLCVVEVHASPTAIKFYLIMLEHTLTMPFDHFLLHTYLWCCRNYKAMLTTLRCTHAPNGVSRAGPLHASSRSVHRKMHLCTP